MKFPIKVILEDIRSAFNVGSVFRTCDAAGIEELILTGITPYPPHNRIPKTALGATESVKWQYIPDKDDALDYCEKNSTLVAVELTEDALNYMDYDFTKPVTLVFGNEISGVTKRTLERCNAVVKIPMFGSKESLNIANSHSILSYEIVRQWLAKGDHQMNSQKSSSNAE